MSNDNWNVGAGNWNVTSNWSGGLPAQYDTAAATSGTVEVTDYETVGGISFSGSALLQIDGGDLIVGVSQLGDAGNSFILGSAGAVLTGSNSVLAITNELTGTASGTVYLEGNNSEFLWQPQASNYPGPGTAVNSSNLNVDFNDSGNGGQFVLSAQFGGTVSGFQNGDSISWSDFEGNDTFTSTIGNDSVTLKDSDGQSITVNFQGVSDQYNSSDLSVSSAGVITTTYLPPAPQVGSATYDAATGQLVVTAATGAGTAPFTTNAADFDPTQLTLTGEDGYTYTLTGGAVSTVSGSSFTVALTPADQLQLDGLLNNNGAASTGNDIFNFGAGPTTYAISAGATFDTGGRASSSPDVTVSDALTPTITGVSYAPGSGVLTLTGTNFEDAGGYGGIDLGQITLTGGSGQTFTFDAGDYGNAVSSTEAVIDLSNTAISNQQTVLPGEEASVNALFDKAGGVSNEGTTYNFAATSGWDSGAGASIATQSVTVACYLAGSHIRTPAGEIPVETLRIGDPVVTASGRLRPIKWIGTRAYSARFAGNNPDLPPIRFKAGSLEEGVPARDLLVSPKHAMFLDGVLIPAEHLVNGATIVKEAASADIRYFHIELESHDVLIAEGALSESFVDDDSRAMFQNAHE
ncbi:Hint domain-containing protein, partial [Rhodoblastus sp.]|uniref:Hint domain-containing protein n=1 Tax=Rhodoblastus sp. TaxID=1962975 RepID=UPI003F9BC452